MGIFDWREVKTAIHLLRRRVVYVNQVVMEVRVGEKEGDSFCE